MIGQDYFDVRSRLMAVLEDLQSLAKEAGAETRQMSVMDNLSHSLRDPFVFVVTGEVNVGKSTFLNALFGEEFCRTGVMPTTDKIHFFKHGPKLKRVPISDTLEEVHVPAEFLRDFHVVDTPGTNSIESEHQEITERFMPSADMVIFVFSAMNPWGASAWQFLEKVHRTWMRNVVFVLQQCDLRAPEELEAIQSYMKQLCRQRFGREFVLFPVSGKKAFLARSSGLDRERLLAESGFTALEEHISKSIGAGGARVGKLGMAMRIAQDILSSLKKLVGGRDEEQEEWKRVLKGLEHSLSSVQARTQAKFGPTLDGTVSDFAEASAGLVNRLRDSHVPANALSYFFSKKVWSTDGMEQKLIEEALSTGTKRWDHAALILEDDVEHSSMQFGTAVRDRLKVELPEAGLKPERAFWDAHKRRFKDRLEELHRDIARGLKLESLLLPGWQSSSRLAFWSVVLAVVSVIAGGALGGLSPRLAGINPAVDADGWKLIGAGVAVFGCLAAFVLWKWSAGRLVQLTKAVEETLAKAKRDLREKLDVHLGDELRVVYAHFDGVLQPARTKLNEQESRHNGLQQRVKDMAARLEKLNKDHKALSAPRKD
jgi:signal recognition particle receptor subunit beta